MGRTGTSGGCWLVRLALGVLLLLAVQGVQCEHEPTESECRPYIEKALKEHHVDEISTEEPPDADASSIEQEENPPIEEGAETNEEQASAENKSEKESNADDATTEDKSTEEQADGDATTNEETGESNEGPEGEEENKTDEQNDTAEQSTNEGDVVKNEDDTKDDSDDTAEEQKEAESKGESQEGNNTDEDGDTAEADANTDEEGDSAEIQTKIDEEVDNNTDEDGDTTEVDTNTAEEDTNTDEDGDTAEVDMNTDEDGDTAEADGDTTEADSKEGDTAEDNTEAGANTDEDGDTEEAGVNTDEDGDTGEVGVNTDEDGDTGEVGVNTDEDGDTAEVGTNTDEDGDTAEKVDDDSQDGKTGEISDDTREEGDQDGKSETAEEEGSGDEAEEGSGASTEGTEEDTAEQVQDVNDTAESEDGDTAEESSKGTAVTEESDQETEEETDVKEDAKQEVPEEDLTKEMIIPDNLRPRDHITQILKLDEESVETESALTKTIESTLKTLKNLYDGAIKPLEILYKYRDLSNRHFGDPEIFSKPLILFMGPWSGGKSSTINYLLDLEFKELALRTGAEPSPAYFNILTYGEETQILDGTQLAADWTFSGLQKFGQGLLDRLRGVRMPSRLLEKVNIVEIPGILEIRKQVQRLFPFNDACQWFIDRADIIFLVYDPAKLDVGPETEAILDQLKGREYQTRIILNKADQVKPEELMRVQGTLIWNISPLMSSQEPPVMYTTSLWSLPYENSAPARLLLAQERALLKDLRDAIDRRVENKIASARRFAVRVRNHAKMVDCYLTTYYNHKTFFGNRKKTSDDIIENPTKYHIYEGLSTLTNISRYDLPDPEMYRDFFRINPLYDFTKLSDTCTYFRGCPINKLDIAIAYDLPELVGKYKKAVEAAKRAEAAKTNS